MTVQELATKHGISRQGAHKHCVKGSFTIGGFDYEARKDRSGRFAVTELSAPSASMPGAESAPRRRGLGELREMREAASLKKTIAQTKLLEHSLVDTKKYLFATWGQLAQEAFLDGFSRYSKEMMEKGIPDEWAETCNSVMWACLTRACDALTESCIRSLNDDRD